MFKNEDIIYAYTRKNALEDGVQVLLNGESGDMAKQCGYKWPVYMTHSVLAIIEEAIEKRKGYLCFNGILWDILHMSRVASRQTSPQSVEFEVKIAGKIYTMWVETGATDIDDPTPCLTFSLPSEN